MRSGIWRKKKVKSRLRMCAPSTSASAIIMTLAYRSFSRLNSSAPIPVPNAVTMSITCAFLRILSSLDLSTLIPLPFRGRTAWFCRSRPCFAVPPAESPSTRKISVREGSRSEQSASFPGIEAESSTLLRRITSRALRAASRARAASTAFWIIRLETLGFSSKSVLSREPTKL